MDRPSPETEADTQALTPLLVRLNDLPTLTRIGKRTIERLRASGKLPKPDLRVGKMPLWKVETIRDWIEALSRNGGAL
jgi:hypothetical protein